MRRMLQLRRKRFDQKELPVPESQSPNLSTPNPWQPGCCEVHHSIKLVIDLPADAKSFGIRGLELGA